MANRFVVFWLIGLLAPSVSPAQVPADWLQQGTKAEAAGDFPRAINLYREVIAEQPAAIPPQLSLGRALRLSGQLDEAHNAFAKILAIVPNHPRASLGMAVVEAQRKNPARANELIGHAVAGGVLPGQLDALKELEPLRQTEAYKKHRQQAERFANPCRYEPEYAAFDFWVGDWDVFVAGQLIARNVITKEMNGCIIHERYQTSNGFIRGESVNYFDPLQKKWKQNWVSNSGNVIYYDGGSTKSGVMAMAGPSHSPGSPIQLQRVTWTLEADGAVTQSVSVSNDDGKTWSPGFSGRYVRSNRKTVTMHPDDRFPENSVAAAYAASNAEK